MYSNSQILSGLQADEYSATTLDKSLVGVADDVIEQAKKIKSVVGRAICYTSCFTDNYRYVCANQKSEDIRFLMSLTRLAGNENVINLMMNVYVALLLQNYDEHHDLTKIQRLVKNLTKMGAKFAIGSFTKQGGGRNYIIGCLFIQPNYNYRK